MGECCRPVVIPLAAASMIAAAGIGNALLLGAIRRVVMKIADRIYQWAAGPIEAESEARGIVQGQAIGIARALDWARRKAEAERDGVPFHEPPPEPTPPPER